MAATSSTTDRAVRARISYSPSPNDYISFVPGAILAECFSYLSVRDVGITVSKVCKLFANCLPTWGAPLRSLRLNDSDIRGLWAIFHTRSVQALRRPLFPNVKGLDVGIHQSAIRNGVDLVNTSQTSERLAAQCPKVSEAFFRHFDAPGFSLAVFFGQSLECVKFDNSCFLEQPIFFPPGHFPKLHRFCAGNHRNVSALLDNPTLRALECGTEDLYVSDNTMTAIAEHCQSGKIKLEELWLHKTLLAARNLDILAKCKGLKFLSIQVIKNSSDVYSDTEINAFINLIETLRSLSVLIIRRCPPKSLGSLLKLKERVRKDIKLDFS